MRNHKKSKRKKRLKINKKKLVIMLVFLLCLIFLVSKAIGFALEYSHIKTVTDGQLPYQIRGIDVSHYQGDVQWDVIAKEDISFALIKATEGSSHVDKKFQKNWEDSHKTNLKIGAYHFMSLETSGEDQAKNFIKHVTPEKNMLPPVVDVEVYGEFIDRPPSKEHFHKIMDPLIKALEKEYKMEPIIYCNTAMYKKTIAGEFDNPIWLADLSKPDKLPDGKDWTFLQYSFEGKLKGYSGYLPHLDLNAYNGSKLDFALKY